MHMPNPNSSEHKIRPSVGGQSGILFIFYWNALHCMVRKKRFGVPHTFSIIFFVMEIVYLCKYFFIENVVYTKRGKLHNYMHIWQWIYKSDASIQMIECYNIYYIRKSEDGTMKGSAVMKTAKDAASSIVVKMTKPHRL